MAENGAEEAVGGEHPSAMSLFAPATQAVVSFHMTCDAFTSALLIGSRFGLRRNWYCSTHASNHVRVQSARWKLSSFPFFRNQVQLQIVSSSDREYLTTRPLFAVLHNRMMLITRTMLSILTSCSAIATLAIFPSPRSEAGQRYQQLRRLLQRPHLLRHPSARRMKWLRDPSPCMPRPVV